MFRRIRAHTGWSQQALGALVGLDQSRISQIERGVARLRDVALVAQVANALRIPPILLGFGDHGTTVGQTRTDTRKGVSWMDRRDFVQHIATVALGTAGVAALDIDRLTALLPHADPTGVRHVGVTDVEVIEHATAEFIRQSSASGAGPIRDLAVAQLRATLPLLGAEMTPQVRPRMYLATARLATQAGWMSFDVSQHDAARRLWMIALDVARATEHPLGTDQTVFVLSDLAAQAVHLDRPDEALRLVHLGHAATAGPHPIAAATSCLLASFQARAYAAAGDAVSCDRALGTGHWALGTGHWALGQANEHFDAIDLAATPPAVVHVGDDACLARQQGVTHYTLALSGRDPLAAKRAVPPLRHAVDGYGPDDGVARALCLSDLAGAHAIAGDTDTAVTLGHHAVDAVTTVSSPRAYDRLRILDTALQPLHDSSGVTELRNRLTTTTV